MLNVNKRALLGATALRGIIWARAEGEGVAEIKKLIEDITNKVDSRFTELKQAHEDFKGEADKKLKDVVHTEKVDKINSAVGDIQSELNKMNQQLAALKISGPGLGGFDGKSTTPEQKAYRQAFAGAGGYLRRGADNGLGEMAVKAALSSDSNPDGGYTVTPELDLSITRIMANVCAMRRISQVQTISTGVYRKPVSLGGATSGWVGQHESRTGTNTPTLSMLDFPAMELYAMPAATQTLLDDSAVDIESWLANEVAITFGEQEGIAFVTGDGNNKPRGILSYTNVADANYAWGSLGYYGTTNSTGFASSNPGDVLVNTAYGLKQGYRVNANWICNRTVQALIRNFKDGQGNYLWQPGFNGSTSPTILGYPVADDDNMPNTASAALPVAFGDFKRGYLIVDRIGVRVLRDPFSSKPNILFYTTKRVGGGIQNFEAIKLVKCA